MILVGFFNKEHPHITQSKLVAYLMLTEATVSRHISTLVTKKLLTKEKDLENKRSYKLSLTPKGVTVYLNVKKIIMGELDMYLSSINLPPVELEGMGGMYELEESELGVSCCLSLIPYVSFYSLPVSTF